VAVREGEEDDVVAGEVFLRRVGEDAVRQREEVWLVGSERRAGVATSGQGADLDVGVTEEQPEQLTACVSTGSTHRDPDCHLDNYARSCKVTQPGFG
jgi:hypothetical protein